MSEHKENQLREEWIKASNPSSYEKGKYKSLLGAENSPLGSDWYPESAYELDVTKTADWWLSKRREELEGLLAEVRKSIAIHREIIKIHEGNNFPKSWHEGNINALSEVSSLLASLIQEQK